MSAWITALASVLASATGSVVSFGRSNQTWTLLAVQVVEAIVLLIVAGVLFDLIHRRGAAAFGEPAAA